MLMNALSLPDDPVILKRYIQTQQSLLVEKERVLKEKDVALENNTLALKNKDTTILLLEERLRLLLHKRYGASSEQAPSNQLTLFNEAEASVIEAQTNAGHATIEVPTHQRKRPGRQPLPKDLPRIDCVHDIPEAEKTCAKHNIALKPMADDISEQLDIIPATVQVIRHIRKKYLCPCCEGHLVTAKLPPQPLPKSQASAGTLAFVVVSKYADGLPLYRQEKIFERIGMGLPRATLANWMIKCGELVQPLINLLREQLLAQAVIHMDETPLQVLKEPGKTAQSKSYMWVQAAGPPEAPIVLFDYAPSRSGQVPKDLLDTYGGALMVDGYDGYEMVCQTQALTRLGCFAHARRKFVEANKTQGKKSKNAKADYALKLIGKLYTIERELKALSAAERYQQRQLQAKPVLDKLHTWLIQTLPTIPPKTTLGKALSYLKNQWPCLVRYIDDGAYPIDNNRVENAIRPFVIGRKAWLFSNSQAGAHASAHLYSLVETAKANGIEPYAYLKQIFDRLPKALTVADIEALLPWNFIHILDN